MNRVGKLNTTLFMNRVVGWELSFTEDFVVIPTIDLEIQLFVGLVMVGSEIVKFARKLCVRLHFNRFLLVMPN
ncbi:hypothetical protein [Leptospira interrogans]|uniref:hypothetical protein n=1 Tax=Leptospira interrogans TaxID=173 RepID=UPI001CE408FB|nr:hypothetical protein [Leptospira interrogans]